MAYNKKNWQDNVSDITAAELNRMEQGIYDNALVTDAIANTLNPTDTETYKTAELTEGQITDVIGVNDIVIKGQTSQDGTPTPSAPVDVNVVSGSNVVNTSNKNLFDKDNVEDGKYINANGTISASANYVTTDFIRVYSGNKYYLPKTYTRRLKYFNSNKQVLSSSDWDIASSTTEQVLTIPDNAYYVRFSIDKTQVNLNTFQFEQGSTATTYEPHQGKEFHLDLGNIELCKIGDYQDYFYKSGSKWYLHKEIKKITSYNGETITTSYISTTGELSTGAKVYYVVNSTNTEITNTTLITQLEAIYNAPLYEQTNITQTNNDLPMVLDITACKDNINGIKAFIRK